jgi:hypothetical protein
LKGDLKLITESDGGQNAQLHRGWGCNANHPALATRQPKLHTVEARTPRLKSLPNSSQGACDAVCNTAPLAYLLKRPDPAPDYMLGPSSLPLPRRFGFFGGFSSSTRIGSIGLDATGEMGLPTRILASSLVGFTAGLSLDLSPGVLAGPDGAVDGLGATEVLSGRAGAFASDAAFAPLDFPVPVAGPGAARGGSGRENGTWAGAWDNAFAGAGADVTLAAMVSFVDPA